MWWLMGTQSFQLLAEKNKKKHTKDILVKNGTFYWYGIFFHLKLNLFR